MMTLSAHAQQLLNSTCSHKVFLSKDGKQFTAIYNGASYWGRIYDSNGNLVETLYADWDEEDQQYFNFLESDFVKAGYDIQE